MQITDNILKSYVEDTVEGAEFVEQTQTTIDHYDVIYNCTYKLQGVECNLTVSNIKLLTWLYNAMVISHDLNRDWRFDDPL